MQLGPEEIKRLIHCFQSKWGLNERACPVCGRTQWGFNDIIYELPTKNGKEVLLALPIVCENCGYMLLFNAAKCGILDTSKQTDILSKVLLQNDSLKSKEEIKVNTPRICPFKTP